MLTTQRQTVKLSSTEAEYLALAEEVKEAARSYYLQD